MSIWAAVKVLVIAVSLGLDVFAVCIGVGMRGIARPQKIRIGSAFATAEIGMTLIGAGLGQVVGRLIGGVAGYLGFAALVGVGIYMIVESLKADGEPGNGIDLSRGFGLLLASLSISLDSLGIGFSILYLGVPLVVSLAAIGFVSILATTAGLTLGRVLGHRVEEGAERWAGVILVVTGLTFAALKFLAVGD